MIHFFHDFIQSFPLFVNGARITIEVTALSLLLAMIIGSVFALFALSRFKVLIWLNVLYVWLIRGTPLILQIVFLYYAMDQSFHINLNAFTAGAFALAFHNGAYLSEILRGSVQSIDKGQHEAASAIGMNKYMAMRRIIAPQAIKNAIPPTINQFIIGLKDSALVAYIGVSELYNVALGEYSRTYAPTEWFLIAGIYYLILTLLFTLLGKWAERRLDVTRKTTTSFHIVSEEGVA
ncbi:amino acid ABC transporter permease [Alicyclobacillus sp. SO9]|uniref:amino acid ABC transporter permease n=1 Tax=Alicyclobacillus sp. SO9 TaxID=2665646 RepID=UPI0018E71261|nr:amino acid ABC transporter permease [Alicyclobacillus sp. SO9]QQE79775.1 amino acid ABC transporter permease [Alicyclobacillus sp. SO9]